MWQLKPETKPVASPSGGHRRDVQCIYSQRTKVDEQRFKKTVAAKKSGKLTFVTFNFQHCILVGFFKNNNSEWLTSSNDADHWLPWFLLAALFPACAQQRVPVMAHAKLCWAAAYMALVKAWTACFLRVILADARGKVGVSIKTSTKMWGIYSPHET